MYSIIKFWEDMYSKLLRMAFAFVCLMVASFVMVSKFFEKGHENVQKERTCMPPRTTGRGIPIILTLIALAWARKAGVLDESPGIKNFADLVLYLFSEAYGLLTTLLSKAATNLDIVEKWEAVKAWMISLI